MNKKGTALAYELSIKRGEVEALNNGVRTIVSLSYLLTQLTTQMNAAGLTPSPLPDEYAILRDATEAAGALEQLRKGAAVDAEDLERELHEAQD